MATELQSLHKEQGIFICDISDAPDGIEMYKPGSKQGVLVSGKPVSTVLSPPLN